LLNEQGQLVVIAEVGIALAGFSSLMAILGSRPAEADVVMDRIRLLASLVASLSTTAFALFPIVLGNFLSDPESVWRGASALSLGIILPYRVYSMLDARRSRRLFGSRGLRAFAAYLLVAGGDLLFITVLFGVAASHAAGLYVLALYFGLLLAGITFLWFAISLLERSPRPPDSGRGEPGSSGGRRP